MNYKEQLERAERDTNIYPTSTQKELGGYIRGQFQFEGLPISIENPKGSVRSSRDSKGNIWNTEIKNSYGFFNGTIGADGDEVDVFIGDKLSPDIDIYIIDQVNENREFDEHKVMLGFKDESSAKKAYLNNYEKDWKGLGGVTKFSQIFFKEWLYDCEATSKPAREYRFKYNPKTQMLDEKIVSIELKGEVVENETLMDLQAQAGGLDFFDTLILEIVSPGGSVIEGLRIMLWLNELSEKGKQIVTIVTGNSYSIASLIMLAAHIKLVSRYSQVMVHNPMIPELSYANANELEEHVKELRELEATMHELYVTFTGLSRDKIKALMDNETFLTPEQSVELGFADMVVEMEKRSYEMTIKPKTEINMSNVINQLRKAIAKVQGSAVVNQLYYGTDGSQIEVYQNDPSTYQKGDRTNMESGSFELADGSTILVKDFEIIEVQKGVAPTPLEPAVAPDPTAPVAPATPAVPAVPVEPIVPPIEAVIPVEPQAPVAPIVPKEPEAAVAPAVPTPIEPQAVEPTKEPVAVAPKEVVSKEQYDAVVKMFGDLKNSYEQLDKKVVNLEKDSDEKFSGMQAFEKVAAQAIDEIATAQSSGFKPSAKATANVGDAPSGSIFSQMKQKAGLKH